MITKKTFMTIVNALDFGICKCRQFCEVNNLSLEETNEFIHGGNLQNDLLKMLETVMLDRYGIIRDFIYKRDENGELFFGIPQRNGVIEIYLITSSEELYEYLLDTKRYEIILLDMGCIIEYSPVHIKKSLDIF